MPRSVPNTQPMPEVPLCETCGSNVSRFQLLIRRGGITKVVDHLVCDCRPRLRPAAT